MLKANLRVGPLTFLIEAATQKDLFKLIAETQEIFSESQCGHCQSENLRYVFREVDGNTFPELWCQDCQAKLVFGQSKQKPGMLFPVRKLIADGAEKGKPSFKKGVLDKKTNGWTKYRGEGTGE